MLLVAAEPDQRPAGELAFSCQLVRGISPSQGKVGSLKYADPVAGTFGDARPGTERGPSFQQYDASLFKDFTIYHEHHLEVRVDAYNLFNLTSLSQPSNNFDGGNFGQITGVSSVNRQLTISAKYQF